jgi:group I intron endonuclease
MVGIYKIISPTNKINIGQSWDINKRYKNYNEMNCKNQTKLYNSFQKYGFENHKFEVIHELPQDITQETLDQYEILYINQYKECGFELMNIKEGGKGGKWSDEMKFKLKMERSTPEWKNFLSSIHKNKVVLEITRDKIAKGRIGKKHSPETMIKLFNRPKISQDSKIDKLNKPVICINDNTTFKSIKEAALYYNIDRSSISKVIRGKNKHVNNLNFKFLNK